MPWSQDSRSRDRHQQVGVCGDVGEVDALEGDDTILLEYALGDERSYLWVINKNRTASHELPPSEQIKKLVESFRRTLLPPQWKDGETAAEYQARARSVDQEFQPPAVLTPGPEGPGEGPGGVGDPAARMPGSP